MAEEVMTLMKHESTYQFYRQNAVNAAAELCWEKEKFRLIDIYRPFL
jgi:hypothetical protein